MLENANFVYNLKDTKEIQNQITAKIASLSAKEYAAQKNGLDFHLNKGDFIYLCNLSTVLEGLEECSPCYEQYQYKVGSIISLIKNNLNK